MLLCLPLDLVGVTVFLCSISLSSFALEVLYIIFRYKGILFMNSWETSSILYIQWTVEFADLLKVLIMYGCVLWPRTK